MLTLNAAELADTLGYVAFKQLKTLTMQHDNPDNPYYSYMVEASAGTGKTYLSTHRYLFLVATHAPIAEIIAITFTIKAATEMHERIVQLASDMRTNKEQQQKFDQQMHDFYQQLNFDAKPPKLGLQVADEVLNQSQRMRVKTIDSIVQEWLLLLASKNIHNDLHYPIMLLEPDEAQDVKRDVWDKIWCESLHDEHDLLASEPLASIQTRVEALLSRRSGLTQIGAQYVEHNAEHPADIEMISYLNKKGRSYVKLAEQFRRLYQEQKQSLGKYEFDDLLGSLHHSIHTDAGALYELQQHISHLLLDEFQDTNDTQWEVFKPICTELMAGDNLIFNKHGIRSTVFMVGDKKQTIYAFRGAKPKIMEHAANDLQTIKHASLQKNYRTTAHLINFYNKLFPNINLKNFQEHTAARADTGDSEIKIVSINTRAKKTKQQTLEIEAEYIAKQIRAALDNGGSSEEDICIMYRSSRYADTFAAALAKQGIRYSKHESRNIHAYQEVADLIALCKWLLIPQDICALLTIVRSQGASIKETLAAHSDDYETILMQIKDRQLASNLLCLCNSNYLPAYELVATALFKYDFLANCHSNSAKHNAINFLDMLIEMAAKGIKSLASVCCKLEKDLDFHSYKPSNAVSLMTVHKSKGLEFPQVYLVQAGDEWTKSDKYWHIENEQIKYIGTSYKRPKALTAMIKSRKQWRNENEETRSLYVALTRAKNNLTITGVEQTKQASFLPVIRTTAEQCGFSCQSEEISISGQQSNDTDDISDCMVMVSKFAPTSTVPATDKDPVPNPTSMPVLVTSRNLQNTEIKTLRPSATPTPTLHWTQKSLQGIYMHKMLERAANNLPYRDPKYWHSLVRGIVSSNSSTLLAQADKSVATFIASDTWNKLFTDACWFKTEQRVSGFKDNTLTHGIIDLLICYPQSQLLVVDYKTSEAPTYHGQLSRYEAIIKAMLPSYKVSTRVVVVPL